MKFDYKYKGSSTVSNIGNNTGMTFVPDAKRQKTFFDGKLNKKLPFREAISALHHIVVSDYRYQKKDNTAYLEWAALQEDIWLAEAMAGEGAVKAELAVKKAQLKKLNEHSNEVLAPYYKARNEYWNYLRLKDRDMWWVLDPVISIHPDQLFFECFSQDESSYGKLSCNYNVFKELNEFECGTTNIDYSVPLYKEFQKIRNYKETSFVIDPSGFEVETTAEESYKEVKIDLPDSWVRGFLQVSSAMTLDSYQFDLHPTDMSNFLFFLKRNREKKGPRSVRWILKKGEPIKAIFEPWNKEIICRRSIYVGLKDGEIRMWGRRRLALLERLIPVSKSIKVTLLGTGLPSFFEVDLHDMVFTLGLSGWTNNDWSRSSNFDLMAPRYEVDGMTQQKVYLELKRHWFASSEDLAKNLGLTESVIESSLQNFVQEGKVIFDMHEKVYRLRELSSDPIPIDSLRYKNEREEKAVDLIRNNKITYESYAIAKNYISHIGMANDKGSFSVNVKISDDERIVGGDCGCRFYRQNKLFQGPCEHIMALRKLGTLRVEEIIN